MSNLGGRLDAIAKMKLRNHSSTFECLAACGEDVYFSIIFVLSEIDQ
jgi:hypothetical protein